MAIPVIHGSIQSERQFVQGFEASSFQSQGAQLLSPRLDELQPAHVLGRELDLDLAPSGQSQAGLTAGMNAQVVFDDQPAICREIDYHPLQELNVANAVTTSTHTDAEIADALNQEGIKTVKDRLWTTPRPVMNFRLPNAIPSGFTTNRELRIPDSGYITSTEPTEQLDLHQTTIQKWYTWGVLSGKQDGEQSPLWIRWTEDVVHRLAGSATPDPRMVSVRSLCRSQGKRPDQLLSWAQESSHIIYRLRPGSALWFYILPQESSVPLE